MKSNIKATDNYDLIIIGAGPAGMTAAIYAQRANLKTVIIEKALPGGKMTRTSEVENYPGFDFIDGQTLASKMHEQIEKLNVEVIYDEVVSIDDDINHTSKTVNLLGNKKLTAKAVIVATGTVEKKIGVPGEDEYYGKGVSYCGVCDGFLFKDKTITVVGGGYAACEESLYLTRMTNNLNLIHRREGFRADDKTVARVKNHPNINMHVNYRVVEVLGDLDKVVGLKIENTETKEVSEIKTDALFPYIGSDPISEFVRHLGVCDEEGYILVDDTCQTKIPGLFAAGDVIKKNLRQIVTATNDGAIAAQYIINYIDNVN
ncbi:thioredoxin-disulfide reductase [Spiroplasma platyhelix]|uniref:Thioredoxin reductase n=1 Tax=Spiroplasma platyhelix PALS-1 TaxID=1276218 RepID=A0A846U0B5_9MOLU|nr:thioredoxin-disulfide reductase [Spiroplasma platyhelix]MBE4704094.1 Thioredoxin reductase [Spiroplasma platyhelix PALS-1]NKE38464.1 thioredoxin-disulfide reductase [Spiroplasma platyhelix PALS-1]UJB29352.1 thioredoxin reductase [Spiroplasma platyhelix PALS-1]